MTDETAVDPARDDPAVSGDVEPPKPVDSAATVGESSALGPLTELANISCSEPTQPEIEWMMYFGVPVEKRSAVDEEKITPATHGRLKVPLSKLVTNPEIRETDIYVSLVVVDQLDESTVKVSDMMITGSSEVVVRFIDPSPMNGLRIDALKGSCLLVLNPVVTGVKHLTVACLKNCMRIGRVTSQLSSCSHPDCKKPVFIPRDGLCCYSHASRSAGLRLSVVGGDHAGVTKTEPELKKKTKPVIDVAEREILREANRKSELIARKKTAVLLANRRSEGNGGNKNPFFNRMRGSDLMELGDVEESVEDDKAKLARFENLKRKRELIEQQRNQVVVVQPEIEPVVSEPSPDRRKSLKNKFDELVLIERGLN